MFQDRNITIIKQSMITVIYTLLTLKIFLKADKLLLSQYNNLKMFVWLFTDKKMYISLVTMQIGQSNVL